MNLQDYNIDKSWTLFLDRDGVINKKIENNYFLKWDDFRFIDGVKEAFRIFNERFGRIIVVTNQQCIGKGLIASDDIVNIHNRMILEINNSGGRIDKIYFSPEKASPQLYEMSHELVRRKPGTAMALEAKKDFPEIDFARSVMVGDSVSDMLFGKRAGMLNIRIGKPELENMELNEFVAFTYPDLFEMASDL